MEYHITLQGKGGHGSRPDRVNNPVVCFAAVYGALQSIGCTVTKVDCGGSTNVIQEMLHFYCTCNDEAALHRILTHTCAAHRCSFQSAPQS